MHPNISTETMRSLSEPEQGRRHDWHDEKDFQVKGVIATCDNQ